MTLWSTSLRHMQTPPPEGQEPREKWWASGTVLGGLDHNPGGGWSLFLKLSDLGSVQHDWDCWHAPVSREFLAREFGEAILRELPEDGWLALEIIEE